MPAPYYIVARAALTLSLLSPSACTTAGLPPAQVERVESEGGVVLAEPKPQPQPVAEPNEALAPPLPPTTDIMLELATSRAAWDRYVDPQRGLAVVEYFEDASGEDPRANALGRVEVSHHLCGTDLSAELDRLHRDLNSRVQWSAPEDGPVFRCEGDTCSHNAQMEFDLAGDYIFVAGDQGPMVEQVVRVEGAAMLKEFTDAARAYAAVELERLDGSRCDFPPPLTEAAQRGRAPTPSRVRGRSH